MITYTATYSPEDNKLRLYASQRLDDETYQKIKSVGFKLAPKQELFVAPAWTPEREDVLIELAGEIEPEEMTLAERAEIKAERLDAAIEKKRREADAFHHAASAISERFAFGQPILVGHHSEKKARKDKERMERAMNNASASMDKARYLAYKAEGVEQHANRKSRSDVRARRIKTLLADLRDVQRDINHGHIIKRLWGSVSKTEDTNKKQRLFEYYLGTSLKTGPTSPWDAYSDFNDGKKNMEETLDICLEYANRHINNQNTYRWIEHILNRLSYERNELGQTSRYEGVIRPVILQTFAREQGTHKPEATKTEYGYSLKSSIPLPLHLTNGNDISCIELSEDGWRDLMQDVGYEVPKKIETGKIGLVPILNLNVHAIRVKNPYHKEELITETVFHITKAAYAKIYSEYKGTRISSCGKFRVRTGFKPGTHQSVAFFITDSKAHDIPDSTAIVLEDAA